MNHTSFVVVQWGDVATWAVAIAGFLAFVGVILGLFIEGNRRRSDIARIDQQRHDDAVSAQARLVGAYITPVSIPSPGPALPGMKVTITNGSELSIRNVQGHLNRRGETNISASTPTLSGLRPSEDHEEIIQVTSGDYELQLDFDDDAGIQWSKYGPKGLLIRASEASGPPVAIRHPRWRIDMWLRGIPPAPFER